MKKTILALALTLVAAFGATTFAAGTVAATSTPKPVVASTPATPSAPSAPATPAKKHHMKHRHHKAAASAAAPTK